MSSEPVKKKSLSEEIPDVLPLLPIRDLVVFPYMIVPLRVTRPVSMEAVTKALETDDRLCFLVAQREASEDDPTPAVVLPRRHHRDDHADAQAVRGRAEGAGAGALPRAHPALRRRAALLPGAHRTSTRKASPARSVGGGGAAALGAPEHRQADRAGQVDAAGAGDGRSRASTSRAAWPTWSRRT